MPFEEASAPAHRANDAERRVGSLLGGNVQFDSANFKAIQPQSRGFAISSAKLIRKNSLVGAFDLELPSGMIIRGAMLLESGGRRWVNLPSESYQKPDGTKGWKPFIEFVSKEVRASFQSQVLPLAERALLRETCDAS